MTTPHDFEFQFGRYRALRGRGWRGLVALGLILSACATITTGTSWVVSPVRTTIAYFGR
jgi:hypothetical protein